MSRGPGGSIAFDRMAARYDETRGGLERGELLAGHLAPHLRPGPVLEVGVGTGVIALALGRHGHPVVGVDLSPPMLERARDRLGPRVALADAHDLPVPDGAVPNVVIVWVLHLVPDITALLAEAGRVTAAGGRIGVIPAGGDCGAGDRVPPVVEPVGPVGRALGGGGGAGAARPARPPGPRHAEAATSPRQRRGAHARLTAAVVTAGPGGSRARPQTVRTTPVERAQRATPRGVEAIDGSREKDHVAMDIATNRVTGST
jgi:SAM-dependent methyltransferase